MLIPIWFLAWKHFDLSIYWEWWECHHPNWHGYFCTRIAMALMRPSFHPQLPPCTVDPQRPSRLAPASAPWRRGRQPSRHRHGATAVVWAAEGELRHGGHPRSHENGEVTGGRGSGWWFEVINCWWLLVIIHVISCNYGIWGILLEGI